jgi:YhcH/YjgK/YiaL family protein
MILDRLELAEVYFPLNSGFAKAFEFLRRKDLAELPVAKGPVNGDQILDVIKCPCGRKAAEAPLEVHRKYVDIQLVLAGTDRMGWKTLSTCRNLRDAYNPVRDVAFYIDAPDVWMDVLPGMMAIFFPDDTHAPMVSDGPIHKIVLKVPIIQDAG